MMRIYCGSENANIGKNINGRTIRPTAIPISLPYDLAKSIETTKVTIMFTKGISDRRSHQEGRLTILNKTKILYIGIILAHPSSPASS